MVRKFQKYLAYAFMASSIYTSVAINEEVQEDLYQQVENEVSLPEFLHVMGEVHEEIVHYTSPYIGGGYSPDDIPVFSSEDLARITSYSSIVKQNPDFIIPNRKFTSREIMERGDEAIAQFIITEPYRRSLFFSDASDVLVMVNGITPEDELGKMRVRTPSTLAKDLSVISKSGSGAPCVSTDPEWQNTFEDMYEAAVRGYYLANTMSSHSLSVAYRAACTLAGIDMSKLYEERNARIAAGEDIEAVDKSYATINQQIHEAQMSLTSMANPIVVHELATARPDIAKSITEGIDDQSISYKEAALSGAHIIDVRQDQLASREEALAQDSSTVHDSYLIHHDMEETSRMLHTTRAAARVIKVGLASSEVRSLVSDYISSAIVGAHAWYADKAVYHPELPLSSQHNFEPDQGKLVLLKQDIDNMLESLNAYVNTHDPFSDMEQNIADPFSAFGDPKKSPYLQLITPIVLSQSTLATSIDENPSASPEAVDLGLKIRAVGNRVLDIYWPLYLPYIIDAPQDAEQQSLADLGQQGLEDFDQQESEHLNQQGSEHLNQQGSEHLNQQGSEYLDQQGLEDFDQHDLADLEGFEN